MTVPAPTSDDLTALIGKSVNEEQADAVIAVVTAMASSYTRGQGFTNAQPQTDLRAVILSASVRLLRDRGVESEAMGPFQVSYRSGFEGWSVAELVVLNRYRERAQ